ncbi:MAG: chromate transporter [Methylotenera sp.]|uniref:chromate efflux transporter n=1 Tax=Methylotenera sp. TaxID=2051956 RepID=UPI000D49E862|nr:chromate efflux transporter [Methylotenera sp.]PPC84087.1 MAG: chromate transporter [Methylotenera sp.]
MDVTNKNTSSSSTAPAPVSFGRAFVYWLKLGFISFGGPAGQISIMHHDLVEQKRWISETRFLHALNYCMVLPGPEAQQLATYIGWLMHRTWGGIVAGLLFVLPSFFILTGLAWVYMAYGSVPAVAGVFYGIKPAVVAIVLFAAYRIGARALKNQVMWGIAALAFIAIFVFKLPFPLIVVIAALIGHFGGRMLPQSFKVGGGHGSSKQHYGAALIDDDTPTPAHAKFSIKRMVHIALLGVGIWFATMVMLILFNGWDGAFTQMAWFFTKAALMTFGGAYAVLPYVYQGAVEHYLWLTPIQMIDGLALGETTPGPLIMVVTFVGFVGGWVSQVFGADAIFASAIVAASIVTFFTFLPSFILIFMGAPFIETTHGNLKFTAPLSAITAAVVGVILNLALFFAYHVFWPAGLESAIDWFGIALTALAMIAIFRFKINVIYLILASGILGMLFKLFA